MGKTAQDPQCACGMNVTHRFFILYNNTTLMHPDARYQETVRSDRS
jgi:hypothetical protein